MQVSVKGRNQNSKTNHWQHSIAHVWLVYGTKKCAIDNHPIRIQEKPWKTNWKTRMNWVGALWPTGKLICKECSLWASSFSGQPREDSASSEWRDPREDWGSIPLILSSCGWEPTRSLYRMKSGYPGDMGTTKPACNSVWTSNKLRFLLLWNTCMIHDYTALLTARLAMKKYTMIFGSWFNL